MPRKKQEAVTTAGGAVAATGQELFEWAKSMGFMAQGKLDAEEFQKLCKGKAGVLWKQVIGKVKSAKELEHIRKNLLLKRIKEGVSFSKPPVSGHFGQKIALYCQLARNLQERDKAVEKVANLELAVRDKEKCLKKCVLRTRETTRQIKECETKTCLLKIKRGEGLITLQCLEDLTEMSNIFCPPAPDAVPFSVVSQNTPVAILGRCLEALREFHDKSSHASSNSHSNTEEQEQRKRAVWKFLSDQVWGGGAQCLWNAITSHHMNQLLAKSAKLAAGGEKMIDANGGSHVNDISVLNGQYFQTLLEAMYLKTQAKVKSLELEKLKETVTDEIEAHFSTRDSNLTELPTEQIRLWVDLHCQRARESSRKEYLLAEIYRLHERSSALDHLSVELREKQVMAHQLGEEIEREKKLVEENPSQMRYAASILEEARGRVIQRLDSFKQQHLDQGQSWNDMKMSFGSANLHETSFLQENFPLSSTMNGDAIAVLSLDATAISLDSTSSKTSSCSGSGVSDTITMLQDAISKEAKMFVKLPLETVPKICFPSGSEEHECSLLVLAPQLIPRVASTASVFHKRILHRIPLSSAPHIILHNLRGLNHLRALLMNQILYEPSLEISLTAPLLLDQLLLRSSEQEAVLDENLTELSTLCESMNSILATCKENLHIWRDHPMQDLIPSNLTVNGATFKHWLKKYNELRKG